MEVRGSLFALASKISLGRCLNFRSEWTQRGRVALFAIIIVCGLASGMQVVLCQVTEREMWHFFISLDQVVGRRCAR